jgi:ribonucleoside-diphosphate reductase alpha chain
VHTRFEPSGFTTNEEIPMAKSFMDYLGRWLALKFLDKDTAKRIHNAELVDKSYSTGTKSKEAFAMHLPLMDDGAVAHMFPETTTKESVHSGTDKLSQAKLQGFTGSICGGCGSLKMKRNGSCEVCLDCGATSGCS